jgi:VanZ family protein
MTLVFTVFFRLIPVCTMMGIIFFLSHTPADSFRLPLPPGTDKLIHIIIYGILAAAAIVAFDRRTRIERSLKVALLVVLFCLVYGLLDELHQSYIPGRDASIADVVADGVGACLFCLFWQRKKLFGTQQ